MSLQKKVTKKSCMKRVHFYLPERLLMDLGRYAAMHDEHRMSQSVRRLLAKGVKEPR